MCYETRGKVVFLVIFLQRINVFIDKFGNKVKIHLNKGFDIEKYRSLYTNFQSYIC